MISTFGFGYNLKSDLLVDIATEGTGTYSFIPDSGFVGTVFVNALANTLTTCADNVSLAIDAEDPTATIHALDGYAVFSKESDRINYSAKTMQIGQSFGSIVRINKSQLPLILAKLTYHSLDSAEDGTTVTVTGPIEEITEEQRQDLALEYFRIETINSIEKAINVSETNNSDRFETAKSAIQDTITKLDRWVSATSDCPGVTVPDSTIPILSARARIIAIGEDLKGQLTEAVSKAEFFMKWGAHFLRSIKRTHMLKQCNNFKDPGVQNYGNVIFQTVRDEADDIFSTLPPPVSSGLRVSAGYGLYRGSGSSSGGGGGYGGGSVSRSAPQSAPAAPPALSMASFNRPDMVRDKLSED